MSLRTGGGQATVGRQMCTSTLTITTQRHQYNMVASPPRHQARSKSGIASWRRSLPSIHRKKSRLKHLMRVSYPPFARRLSSPATFLGPVCKRRACVCVAALHGSAGGKQAVFTRQGLARHHYFDDTCGWRTKTRHIRQSRRPKPLPKEAIWRKENDADSSNALSRPGQSTGRSLSALAY